MISGRTLRHWRLLQKRSDARRGGVGGITPNVHGLHPSRRSAAIGPQQLGLDPVMLGHVRRREHVLEGRVLDGGMVHRVLPVGTSRPGPSDPTGVSRDWDQQGAGGGGGGGALGEGVFTDILRSCSGSSVKSVFGATRTRCPYFLPMSRKGASLPLAIVQTIHRLVSPAKNGPGTPRRRYHWYPVAATKYTRATVATACAAELRVHAGTRVISARRGGWRGGWIAKYERSR